MGLKALKNLTRGFCLKVFGAFALVLALCAGVAAAPSEAYADTLADGTYSATGLSLAVLNMYHFHDPYVVVRGDDAWLITTSDNGNTTRRYDGMAYGPQSQILDATDITNHTLVAGTSTANVINNYLSDGSTLDTRTFVLPVPKYIFESGSDIYYMIKYVAGYSDAHDGDWYKANGGDYYFTGYTLEYLSDSTVLPGEGPAPIDEPVDLTVTNAASGLTASQAVVTPDGSGNAVLSVNLAGGEADWLYVGTLAQALGSGSTGNGWLAGEDQSDGSKRFDIPIDLSMDYLPFSVVPASSGIDAGIHPYQFILDIGAATLRLERYDNIFDIPLTVASSVAPGFATTSTATVRVIGGPNDDVFKCAVTLAMEDEAYDYIEYQSVLDGGYIQAGTALSGGSFLLVFENSAGKTSFTLGQASTVSMHHADSDLWLDRTMTVDLAAGAISIGGSDESEAVARALIEALPKDPMSIRAEDSDAVAKASAAYNALSAEAQETLDTDKPPFSNVPYGRVLENSLWALDALNSVDAVTALPDGVYTTGIESESTMGKSQSTRTKGFKVLSVTVKNGIATAKIEHDSTTDGIMLVNGKEYASNKAANNTDRRTYDVPINLNTPLHIVWKAQDAGSSVTGITYEITNSIDETRTTPDSALPADEGSSSSDDIQGMKELLEALAKLIASQSSTNTKPSNSTTNPNATTANNSSALAAAAASRTGSSGNSKYGKSGASESTDEDGTPVATKASMSSGNGGSGASGGTTGSYGSSQTNNSDAAVALSAVLLCLAALGVLGFTYRFVRRERQD